MCETFVSGYLEVADPGGGQRGRFPAPVKKKRGKKDREEKRKGRKEKEIKKLREDEYRLSDLN